jgi:uncharacterized protein with HEPN domain
MDNDIKTWLYDILQSIDEIDSYYDNKPKISDDLIWSIVINHLPKLKDEVSGLLNE